MRLALGQAYAQKRSLLPFFLDLLAFFLPTLVRVFDGRSKAEKARMVGTDTVTEGTPKVWEKTRIVHINSTTPGIDDT